MKRISLIVFLGLALAACSAKEPSKTVTSAQVTGVVKDSLNKPLNGVMVRVTNETSGISQSVFTDEKGRYELSTRLTGDVTVRFRLPYYRDETNRLMLTVGKSVEQQAVLKPMTGTLPLTRIQRRSTAAKTCSAIVRAAMPWAIASRVHHARSISGWIWSR